MTNMKTPSPANEEQPRSVFNTVRTWIVAAANLLPAWPPSEAPGAPQPTDTRGIVKQATERKQARHDLKKARRAERRKHKSALRQTASHDDSSSEAEDSSSHSSSSSSSEDELLQDPRPNTRITSLTDAFRRSARVGYPGECIADEEDDELLGPQFSATPNPAETSSNGYPYSPNGTLGHRRTAFLASQRDFDTETRFMHIHDGLHNLRMNDLAPRHIPEVSERRQSRRRHEKQVREEEAARLAREEEERKRKEAKEQLQKQGLLVAPTKPFLGRLSKEWQDKVKDAMKRGGTDVVAYGPGGNEPITRRDFGMCFPQQGAADSASGWLNDQIVMNYLKYSLVYGNGDIEGTLRSKLDKPAVRRYLTFESAFYPKLTSQGPESVRRWASRLQLKQPSDWQKCEIVFVPICHSLHWTIAAIRPQLKRVDYYDSMGTRPGAVQRQIFAFLADQLKGEFNQTEWAFDMPRTPQQTNGSDCGVFAITAAHALVLGLHPLRSYSDQDMPEQRKRILAVFLNGGFKGDFKPVEDPRAVTL